MKTRTKISWSAIALVLALLAGGTAVAAPPFYTVTPRPLEQSSVPPRLTNRDGLGGVFVDFGLAAFGTITFTADSPAAQTMMVLLGEKRGPGYTVDRHPPGNVRFRRIFVALRSGRHQYRVEVPADGRNTGRAAIRMPASTGEVVPFRYAELRPLLLPAGLSEIRQLRVLYPFVPDASSFTSSDPTLNAVWELCRHSIIATSFAGVFVDGDRERIPYEADAYISQLGTYAVTGDVVLARYSLEYLIQHPTWPLEWSLHVPLMAWADLLYSGDPASARAFYPDLRAKALTEFARPDGLILRPATLPPDLLGRLHFDNPVTGGFFRPETILAPVVDWPPSERDGYDLRPVNTVVNCFHYRALVALADIAASLGKTEDESLYRARAARVAEAINAKLFNPATGLYRDGEGSTHSSLHANLFPLAFGITPPDRRPRVAEFVRGRGMACSVYAAQYLLEALYRAGEEEHALRLLTDRETDRGWPHMLDLGSTITLEAWDPKYKPNLDWNHAWGAAPANIIPRMLMGIEPAAPGFARARIIPRTAGLESASITIPTVRGPISLDFKKTDQGREYRLTLPAGMPAELWLPAADPDRVRVNGAPASTAGGVRSLGYREGRAGFEVEGDHRFVVR